MCFYRTPPSPPATLFLPTKVPKNRTNPNQTKAGQALRFMRGSSRFQSYPAFASPCTDRNWYFWYAAVGEVRRFSTQAYSSGEAAVLFDSEFFAALF